MFSAVVSLNLAVAGLTLPQSFSSVTVAGLTLPQSSVVARSRVSNVRMVDAAADDAPKFCLNVKLCIKPERRDEFMECIKNNKAGTIGTEPLAEAYIWGEDTETKNTFHFYEKYKGKAGFEAHQKTPHFAAWEAFASTEPFSEPPVVQFYEEL